VMWSVAVFVEEHLKLETLILLFQCSTPTSYGREH